MAGDSPDTLGNRTALLEKAEAHLTWIWAVGSPVALFSSSEFSSTCQAESWGHRAGEENKVTEAALPARSMPTWVLPPWGAGSGRASSWPSLLGKGKDSPSTFIVEGNGAQRRLGMCLNMNPALPSFGLRYYLWEVVPFPSFLGLSHKWPHIYSHALCPGSVTITLSPSGMFWSFPVPALHRDRCGPESPKTPMP